MDDTSAGVTLVASRSIRFALTEDPAGPSIGIRGPGRDGAYELSMGDVAERVAADRLYAALVYLAGRVYLDTPTRGWTPPSAESDQ